MSGDIIRVDMGAGGWAAVPRAVFDNDHLSLKARGLLAWFLTRGDGFYVCIEHVRRRFALGRDAWKTLAGELIAAGHYHRKLVRVAGGRIRTEVSITAMPSLTATDVGLPDTRSSRQSAQPIGGESDTKQETGGTRYKTTTTTAAAPAAQEGTGGGGLVFQMREAPDALVKVLKKSEACRSQWQALLDELDGAAEAGKQAGKPVLSESAYLRKLARVQATEGFNYEHAERVARDRNDRLKAAWLVARQDRAQGLWPSRQKTESAEAGRVKSPAKAEALAKMAEIRKSVSPRSVTARRAAGTAASATIAVTMGVPPHTPGQPALLSPSQKTEKSHIQVHPNASHTKPEPGTAEIPVINLLNKLTD